jgi:hypothetical protein
VFGAQEFKVQEFNVQGSRSSMFKVQEFKVQGWESWTITIINVNSPDAARNFKP